MSNPYPVEELDPDEDNGTMVGNVDELRQQVVGHRIVSAQWGTAKQWYGSETKAFIITLDNGKKVKMLNTDDCCAYTDLNKFLVRPDLIDHIITGVGTTNGYTNWHIYADMGDVLELDVNWSPGNAFYYGFGFDIQVEDV